jgi:transcriptional regulator with XRE-family HTH domain
MEPGKKRPVVTQLPQGLRGGPTALRIILGAQLRRLRESSGMSRENAGAAIRSSGSKISRLELGRIGFKQRDVADLLTLYGIGDAEEREMLLALARAANTPGWWHQYGDILPDWFEAYVGLEEAASLIRTYEVQFIPGLLQTEQYARDVMLLAHDSDDLDRRVALRRRRQRLLAEDTDRKFWFLVDEGALLRPFGGPETMAAQLLHLAEVSRLPQVTLQIVPFAVGRHGAAGCPFTILRFAELDLPDVVYLEQLTSALYLDKPADVDTYLHFMEKIAISALTPEESRRVLLERRREYQE